MEAKKTGREIICRIHRLIMLAREIGVHMVLLSSGVKETGMITVPTK